MAVYVQSNIIYNLPAGVDLSIHNSLTGQVLIVPEIKADRTYTLPDSDDGLHFIFIKNGAAGNIATIAGPGAGNMRGVCLMADGSTVVANNSTNIRFTATAVTGDYISLFFDGTNWTATGYSQAGTNNGIDFT